MKKFSIGIDISKEKINTCLRSEGKNLSEGESANRIAAIKKHVRKCMKEFDMTSEEVVVCAEYTGKYIYPLVCACHEMGLFLWMEDPTRIKHSFGMSRGKDDRIDARRIAEYAERFQDKAVAYGMPDKTLSSIRELLSDRDTLLEDRKRYQTQLNDQKNFMDAKDYRRKSRMWEAVIRTINQQLEFIDSELAELVASDDNIKRQMRLLKTVDGVGDVIAIYMIAVTMGFTRFKTPRQFYCYAGLAPFQYTSGKSIHSKSKVSQRADKRIKALLHLAAVSVATRMKDSDFYAYYERKRADGKHPMSVLNVVRAKLVSRMFAVVRRNSDYQRKYDVSVANKNYFKNSLVIS